MEKIVRRRSSTVNSQRQGYRGSEIAPANNSLGANAAMSHCMAELYSIALSLPPVEPETTGGDGAPFQTDEWNKLHRLLKEKIGPRHLLGNLRLYGEGRTRTGEPCRRHFRH